MVCENLARLLHVYECPVKDAREQESKITEV
jgi:hypothetical protein